MTRYVRFVTTCVAVAAFVSLSAAQQPGPVYLAKAEGVTPPKLVKETKPKYTNKARAERIQGYVVMDVVVLSNGDVGDVKVTRSVDKEYGLDEEAVRAVKQWKFKPGTKDGQPVPVKVEVEMTFVLK